MSFAKNIAFAGLLTLGLLANGCSSTSSRRDFPPRVDRYLANEFSRGLAGLAESGGMFYDMAARDVSNTAGMLTEGLPNYLGHELWQKPQDMSASLADLGARECHNAKNLPGAFWDFLELLFGI